MKEKVDVKWQDEMAFEASLHENTQKIMIDAVPAVGGRNLGPRPKTLMLVSLGGCTAMDVISILKKMRVTPDYFNVEVEGELTEEHPKYFHSITVNYIFRGKDLPMDKIEKAVKLSEERYCGVTEMLKKSSKITSNIIVED
ncbi:MAG: OsmC family protein [Bacteroidales bacterium]|nr:OsmC family protein [Bacteroidales bacterium]